MFGGAKPTFGTGTTTTGFGGFNATANASPFGQSAFGKPATTAFGAAPTFGSQQNTTSLFGASTAQQQPTTSLFGGAATSSTFGGTTATQPAFGSFAQPQQNTSLFGGNQTSATPSLFGQTTTSAFGSTVKPPSLGGFGQAATQQPSLFGQTTTQTSTGGFGTFGQTTPATTNVFGSSGTAFGQPAANVPNPGSAVVKYNPIVGSETLMKNGQQNNVSTKHHCITAMKEYEAKSLEELRMEDYLANRKGVAATSAGFFSNATQPATSTGLFGQAAQPTTGLFGQPATSTTENKGLFGTSAFGQNTTTGFGMGNQQSGFGMKPFSATGSTGFGTSTDASNNPFGGKPAFGATTTPSLFGQTPAASTAPAFGQTSTGFGGFGSTAGTTQPSLFGGTTADANKPTFGLGSTSTANTGFGGFGTTATSTASGGLYNNSSNNLFGAAPAFGATSQANTGFGGFGNTSTGLFNSNLNKTATSGFGGFGTTQTPAATLNFNTGSNQQSLFGNNAAKPTGLFGSNPLGSTSNTTGTGLFGNTTNQSSGFGGGLGLGSSLMGGSSMQPTLGAPQQQTIPIHQQILSKVTSPYGDSAAFKDLKRTEDPARATNPEAQKAIIDSTSSQFKINTRNSPGVLKVKPVGNNLMKKSLFEGLEESDSTVESFTLKPNAKRLIIKPKSNSSTPTQLGSRDQSNGEILPEALNTSGRNESFSGAIPSEPAQVVRSATTPNGVNPGSSANKENDSTRRESWLHPNNLEKVRQHNLNAGPEVSSPLNSTLTELVPRKPLETYRASVAGSTRLSISAIQENPFEDQATTSNAARRETLSQSENQDDSLFANRSYGADEQSLVEEPRVEYEEHPTGIKLSRVGYYTVPSLDDLKSYIAEDGSCVVPNFTIGRTGYGNVYFPKEINVADLNIDEIVHFRNKEITIYPDDENKPPVGSGLNREAQVTLDKVWPLDKTKQELITDPVRLAEIDWEGRLRRVCDKNDTRFVEYRPETGSWVFRVKHFSKYGLNDSDEDDAVPTDPKKAKMTAEALLALKNLENANALKNADNLGIASNQTQKVSEMGKSVVTAEGRLYTYDESAEFMLIDKTKFFEQNASLTNNSMFDAQRFAQSPTAILAKASGTDPHKLQLMKASFFMDDETQSVASDLDGDHDFPRSEKQSIFGAASQRYWGDNTHNRISSGASSHVNYPQMPGSSSSLITHLAEARSDKTMVAEPENICKMAPFIFNPKVAQIKTVAIQVPYKESICQLLGNKCAADLSLMNARMFKLNFGPGNTFVIPTSKQTLLKTEIKNVNLSDVAEKVFPARSRDDYSSTVLQQIKLTTCEYYENFEDSVIGHLEIQLKNTVEEFVDGSECPFLLSNGGYTLIEKHLEEAEKNRNRSKFEAYVFSVWGLCWALWGYHEELEDEDPNSHFSVMFRRGLVSEWIENLIKEEKKDENFNKNVYEEHLIDLIMSHKISEASDLALLHNDPSLAGLLGQLNAVACGKDVTKLQLSEWVSLKADMFIDKNRLKLLMFLSGVPLLTISNGVVNLLEDLDWIQVFAMELWYFTPPTLSITDALIAYCNNLENELLNCDPPFPPYFKEYSAKQYQKKIYDLRFHLLKLFSQRSYSLENILNPIAHTPDPLDYRLSWHLMVTLQAIGYTHSSDVAEAQVHVGFAAQLESYGMWEWAIFILLHIKQRSQREIAVQNLLYRYVTITKDTSLTQKERFIIEHFSVPEKWVDYAKAVKAGSLRNYHLQAKYLIKAKQWNIAHDLIFKHIAPDAVINDNLDYLKGLLIQFESLDLKKSIKVSNWSNQGQIFLDFIDMKEKFKNLRNLTSKDDIETHWENIKPRLSDLCSRISLLPCPTAKHRLCQSEIAQNLAALIRGVLIMCPDLNPCLIIHLALERLPLPQEFAQKELRALLDMLVQSLKNNSPSEKPTSPMLVN